MPNRAMNNQIYVIQIRDHTWNPCMLGKGFEFDANIALQSSDPTRPHQIFIPAHNHD